MKTYRITAEKLVDNWVLGKINDHEFEAKVYDVDSQFGIDSGRVCKLAVYGTKPKREIIIYERGWDKYPAPEYEDLLDALLKYCAVLPDMEDRQIVNGSIVSKEALI